MAENKEIRIRVTGEDAGVGRVLRDIQRQVADTARVVQSPVGDAGLTASLANMKGRLDRLRGEVAQQPIRPRFEFGESLVRNEMARMIRVLRDDAKKHTIEVQARAVVSEARSRVFGAPRDPLRTIDRSAEEQAIRDAVASRVRVMRESTRRAAIEEAANARLFGAPQAALRMVDRSADEQLIRDRQARRLRAQREERRALAEDTAKNGLLGGAFKDVGSILRGGGAAVGINILARTLKDATAEASRLRIEYERGNISIYEMGVGLARTLPILGNIWDAGRGIRELFTREAEAAAKVTAEAERTNQFIAARVALLERAKANRQASDDAVGGFRERADLARLTGEAAARERASQSFGGDIRGVEAESRKRKEALKGEREELERLKKEAKDFVAPAQPIRPGPAMEGEFNTGQQDYEAAVAAREKALTDFATTNTRIAELEKALSDELRSINADRNKEARAATAAFTAEQVKEAEDRGAKIRAALSKSVREFAADFASNLRERVEQGAEANTDREGILRRARIESLEAEALAGRAGAGIEAEKLRVAEEYRKKRVEIARILEDENASERQKQLARSELADSALAERRAIARVGVSTTPRQFAPLEESRGLTGVGAALRNAGGRDLVLEETKQQTAAAKKNNEQNEQMKSLMRELISKLTAGGGQNFRSIFGTG